MLEFYEGDTTEEIIIGVGVIFHDSGEHEVFEASSEEEVEHIFDEQYLYGIGYYGCAFYEYGTPEFEKYKELI